MASTGELINGMRDHPGLVDVSYRTMRRRCGDLQERARALGYDRWLPLSRDWHVSYARSYFGGVPCYFMTWSAIEQVFTPDGLSPREWHALSSAEQRRILPTLRP